MRQIHFFALREDHLPVLEAVELHGPLKYVRTGNFTEPGLRIFAKGCEIPDLGKAGCDSSISCDTYLVAEANQLVNVRHIKTSKGIDRYCVDQLINPDTVTFTPAGLWKDGIVLAGRVATVSDTAIAQAIMKRFSSALKKRFVRVRAYLVGTQAVALLDAGKRLTVGEQCPTEGDLKR